MKLLYHLAYWHGLAKLRLHTDLMLDILDNLTSELGKMFRDFVKHTCQVVETKELPREYVARQRKQEKTTKPKAKTSVKKGAKRQKIAHGDPEPGGCPNISIHARSFPWLI